MKRSILAVMMAAACLLACPAAVSAGETEAEDGRFEIRHGIYLGDSFEDVLEKNDLGFEADDYATYEENSDGIYYVWTNKATIAGVDGTQVRYGFEDKVLVDVMYSFPYETDKDSIDSQYSTFYKSLSRKYGTPLGNTGGSIELITSSAFEHGMGMAGIYEAMDGVGDYRDYDEWEYKELDAYNVKIDLLCYYYGMSYSEAKFANDIGYRMYTEQDEADAIAKKQSENSVVDDDL